ncbi:hypothetical protein TrCOL_g8252, partial [Triparma columacea]
MPLSSQIFYNMKAVFKFDDFLLPDFGKESHPQTWPKVLPVSAKVAIKSPSPVSSSSAKLKPKAVLQVLFKKSSSEALAKLKADKEALILVPPPDKVEKKKPSKVVPVKGQWKVVKRAKAAKVPVKEAKGGKQAAPSLQRESKAAALSLALQASFLEAGSLGKKLLSSSRAKSVFQGKRKAEEKKRKASLAQFQAPKKPVLESKEVSLKARRKARKRAKQAKKRFKR